MIDVERVRLWSVHFLPTRPLGCLPCPGMVVEEVEGPGYGMPQGNPFRIPRETGGQITLTLEGRGCLTVGNETYACVPGTAFLYRDCDPLVSYCHPGDGKGRWRFVWINFVGLASEELIARVNAAYGHFFRLGESRELEDRLPSFRNRSGTLLSITALEGAALVFGLLDILCNQSARVAVKPAGSQLVQAVRQAIARAFGESLSAGSLARRFGISREHLSRTFRAETGRTLQEYLSEFKLSSARDLLLRSNLDCKEIAQRCHYGSYSSFFRAFVGAHGLSPEEFRRRGTPV